MIADVYDEVHYSLHSFSSGASPSFFVSPTSFIDAIRADIPLIATHSLKLWGQLKGSNKLPLFQVKIQLAQVIFCDSHYTCHLIAETSTDESGFYFFDLPDLEDACYQLIIYSRNSLNNKILSPDFNPCQPKQGMCNACQNAILHYLKQHVAFPFGHEHFASCIQTVPILTTHFVSPQYR